MPKKKLLIDFLADYVHKTEVRCKVLKAEETGLRKYGLDAAQRLALLSLDKNRIVTKILDEIGVDLDALQQEIWGGPPKPPPPPPPPPGGGLSPVKIPGHIAALASAAYSEGRIHIRLVKPDHVALGKTETVVIRGQGFDKKPKVQFQHDTSGTIVAGRVTKVTCDVDVHQSVTVRVKLTEAGSWTVAARNAASEPWGNLDQKKVNVP